MAVIWLFSNILFFSVWLGRRFTSEVSTERSYNIWSACSRIHKAWIKQDWTPWYIPRCCGEAWSLEGKIYSILEWHLAFLWTFVLDEKNSIIGLQSKGISAGHLIFCLVSLSLILWPHVKHEDMGKVAGYDLITAMLWQTIMRRGNYWISYYKMWYLVDCACLVMIVVHIYAFNGVLLQP